MAFNLRASPCALFCCALLFFAACAQTAPLQPQPSPLGAGKPHPEQILVELFRSMEARDWPALCACIAVPDSKGKPIALVPGQTAPAVPPADAWLPEAEVQGLRSFLKAGWKRVVYSDARTLADNATVLAVAVRVAYDFGAIPEAERRMLLGAASARAGKMLNWDGVAAQMRERERMEASGLIPAQRLAFALVQGRWRLWLGPVNL